MKYIYYTITSGLFLLTACGSEFKSIDNNIEIFPENTIDGVSISAPKKNNPGVIDGITYVEPKTIKKTQSSKLISEKFSLSEADFTKKGTINIDLEKLNKELENDRFKDTHTLKSTAQKVLESTEKQNHTSQIKQMRGDSYLYLAYTNINDRVENLNAAINEYQLGEDNAINDSEKGFFIGAKAFAIKALYFIQKNSTLENLYESNQLCTNAVDLINKSSIEGITKEPFLQRIEEIGTRCNLLILLNDLEIAKKTKNKIAENQVFNDAIIKFEELSNIKRNNFNYYASLYQYAVLASKIDNSYNNQVKKYSTLLDSNIIAGNLKKDPEQTLIVPWIM